VSDVFISNRLNIKKQRFGLVRFQGVQNNRELENHLNTIWIGSWKLNANRPKYNRAAETRKEWNVKLKEKAIESEKEGGGQKEQTRTQTLSSMVIEIEHKRRTEKICMLFTLEQRKLPENG